MCNAFSFIVTRAGKVFWKCGLDSHDEIIAQFKLNDDKAESDFVRCEIAPKEKAGYLHPKEIKDWVFRFDNEVGNAPEWWQRTPMRLEGYTQAGSTTMRMTKSGFRAGRIDFVIGCLAQTK